MPAAKSPPVFQSAKWAQRKTATSPPLGKLGAIKLSVVSCQVLREPEELFYSAQLLTGGEAAAVFWSSVPNPVSSKTENAN